MDNMRGAILMTASMACFAIEDMFVKHMAAQMTVGMILVLLGVAGGMVFAVVAKAQGHRFWAPELLHWPVILRNLGEMIGTLGFVYAVALTPLSSASAILQALPLAVTLGAALFLGAEVGWRRWSAIGVGFIGVLLIIRPGLDAFQPASLFALQGVFGLAMRDLATRACPSSVSSMQLSSYGFLSIVPVGLALLAFYEPSPFPQGVGWWQLLGALIAGVIGYYMIVAAMRIGDVPFVTPFRYTRLIFAMITGAVFFGERPDAMTLLGGAIVVGSGLYTLLREARLTRAARRAVAADLAADITASPVRPSP